MIGKESKSIAEKIYRTGSGYTAVQYSDIYTYNSETSYNSIHRMTFTLTLPDNITLFREIIKHRNLQRRLHEYQIVPEKRVSLSVLMFTTAH